jgi:hypothetical protein
MAILRRITGRAVFATLLFAGGVAGIVYAAQCHTIDVIEVQEEEVFLPADSPFGPGSPFGGLPPYPGGSPGMPPFPEGPPSMEGSPFPEGAPFAGPPGFGPPLPFEDPMARKIKAIKTTEILHVESEPKVVLEVTVGGVTLADSGRIERTYIGDEGPALCPT